MYISLARLSWLSVDSGSITTYRSGSISDVADLHMRASKDTRKLAELASPVILIPCRVDLALRTLSTECTSVSS